MPVELPDELFSPLRAGVPALLLTVDEYGFPHTAFTYSSTQAKNSVACVVDEHSTTEKNIARTQKASIQILAEGNCVYLLKGIVRIEESILKNSPAPAHRAILELNSVMNQAWAQVQVAPLAYEYTERAHEWVSALPSLYAELRRE